MTSYLAKNANIWMGSPSDSQLGSVPLSAAQREIWIAEQQLDGANRVYTIADYIEIKGPVDAARFESALRYVVAEADCLHARFAEDREGPVQLAGRFADWPLPVVDVSAEPDSQAAAQAYIASHIAHPFDLAQGPLFSYALIKVTPALFFWLQSYHHIVLDGFGASLLVRRVAEVYTALATGRECGQRGFGSLRQLLDSDAAYRASAAFAQDRDYWIRRFADQPEPGRLGGRPGRATAHLLRRVAHFPPPKLDALRAAARQARVPWAVLLLAAAALYTQRLSGAKDVVLGLPVTARTDATLKRTPGMASNAVPLRLSVRPDLTWSAFVAEVAQAVREALAHQRYRGEDIQRDLGLSGSARSWFAPTVNIMTFDHDLRFAEAPATARNLTVGQASDWSIVICDRRDGAGLSIDWHAHPEVFAAAELAAHQDRFMALLETLSAADPAQPVGLIDLLLPAERRQWLADCTGPVQDVPPLHLPALFEAQTALSPHRPALIYGDIALNYAEFNLQANRLAHHLIALGAGPERRVALMLPRSVEGVVALMAVLKTGAAYVPIDPDYPAERIGFMLADAKPVLLLAHGATLARLEGLDTPVVLRLDDASIQAELARQPDANPTDTDRLAPLRLNHPAYVIYTSGSTGWPKGVVVEHRSVSNYLAWTVRAYPAARGLALLHSPLSFDLTVTALWTPLVAGGCVHVAALEDAPDPSLPPYRLLKATPSHLPLLVALSGELDFAPDAEFLFGGEALLGEALAEWRRLRPEAALLNVYGPTEATVNCAEYRIEPGQPIPAGPVPIGRPQGNARLYILDAALQPMPTGVVGELYISGAGLARGYLDRPGLTAKRFVADPFGGLLGEPGARMYRTGDRARWLDCGNLEFLGRVDEQVKVRGFRIELGEIEAALARHPGVAQAAVIVREDRPGDKRLVAYVVTEGEPCPVESLRQHLGLSLPDYMAPAAFVVLDALPLTPNGKLNRKALPVPDVNPVAPGRAPQSPQERQLCQLFAEVLGLERVGVDDSFFALGGDSIIAIQLVSRARKVGWAIASRDVFEHKTPAGLAAVARSVSGSVPESPEDGIGEVVLTPIMRRLCERGGLLDGYSQGVVLQTPAGFAWDDLARLLQALLDRHDMLRARLVLAEGQCTMQVEPVGAVAASRCLVRVDAVGWDDETARQAIVDREAAATIARLAPQAGLMLQATWLDRGPAHPGRLVLVVNHLVVDGVSLRILTEDLAAGARQLAAGRKLALEPCVTPFRHWAGLLAAQALTAARVGEMAFWAKTLGSAEPPLGGRGLDPVLDTVGACQTFRLTLASPTEPLLTTVPTAFHASVEDVLLCGFALAMVPWRRRHGCADGRTSVLVEMDGHGRQEHLVEGADLSRTVGWFTARFPVLLDLAGIDLFEALAGGHAAGQTLKRVKEQLRAAPDHGLGYGLLRYLNPETEAILAALARPQITFNYLGRFAVPTASDWAVVPASTLLLEGRGDAALPVAHALNIAAWTEDRPNGPQLHARWLWPAGLLSETAVRELAEAWFQALETLADHATRPGVGGHTASDFPLAQLSQAEMDSLFAP